MMLHIAEIQDPETVYACQMGMTAPLVYRVDFETIYGRLEAMAVGAGRDPSGYGYGAEQSGRTALLRKKRIYPERDHQKFLPGSVTS